MERFDIKTETKLLKALNKIFREETENQEVPMGELFYMDPANVTGIICKTERMKHLFIRFTSKHYPLPKVPSLKYEVESKLLNLKNQSTYSIEYLKNIIDVFSAYSFESVKVTMLRDMPITFECDDFKIILAPRCSEDD